jgi:hypothetical protein
MMKKINRLFRVVELVVLKKWEEYKWATRAHSAATYIPASADRVCHGLPSKAK